MFVLIHTASCPSSHEEHRQPQAENDFSTAEKNDTITFTPLNWKGTDNPCDREIVIYAVLKTLFDWDSQYRARTAGNAKFSRAVKIVNLILPASNRIAAPSLTSYLGRAASRTPGVSLGKYKGKVRWVRFSSVVERLLLSCADDMKNAAADMLTYEQRQHVLECAQLYTAEWITERESSPPPQQPFEVSSALKALNFPSWRYQKEQGQDALWMFGDTTGRHAIRSILFLPDGSFTTYYLHREFKIPSLPRFITSMEQLSAALLAVQDASICSGVSYNKYCPLIEKRADGGKFLSKEGELSAYAEEEWVPSRCIRSSKCSIVMESARLCCSACKASDSTLRSELSRLQNRGDSISKFTPRTHLSRDGLLITSRRQSDQCRSLQRKSPQIEEYRKQMVTLKKWW